MLKRIPEELRALEAASVLDPIDVHFSVALSEVAEDDEVAVLLAAALVSRRSRDGHVCVPLAEVAGRPMTPESDQGSWPELDAWRQTL